MPRFPSPRTGTPDPGLYDVVVIGGGPAGSAAAIRARQQRPDARVLLLDREDFPRDKACGDGIAPHGVDELRRLGVEHVIEGYRPVGRLRVVSPGGSVVAAATRRPNHVIPRAVFDARLVDAARDRGVEVLRHRLRRLEVRSDRVVVDGTYAGRVLIGADGANSVVRRQLGIPASAKAHTAVAIRGYAPAPRTGPPEQLIAMVSQGWPAYAWSFPIGDGRANVGFGLGSRQLGSGRPAGPGSGGRDGPGRGGRAELVDRLAQLLPDQPATDLRAHHLPLSSGRPRQPDGPVLLAGDALSLINPLTGEGIYYALLSGRLAADAAVRHAGQAGGAYRASLRRHLGRHLRHTSMLTRLAQSPGFLDAAVDVAGRQPAVFDTLVELGLGAGTVPPRMGLRVARAWLRAG